MGINWQARVSDNGAHQRAGGRKRWNSLRTFLADDRRRLLLELLIDAGGLERGAQSRIAEALGVHRSTISKDLKRILPLAKVCEGCGTRRPRLWLEDE